MKSKKNILILGGGGFIGSHLVEFLRKEYSITVFDKKNFSRNNLRSFEKDIEIIEGDFYNIKDIENLVRHKDYIFHLVWSTLPANSNKNPIYDVETNALSSLKLLEVLKNKKKTKTIFVSSGGTVYGNTKQVPTNEDGHTDPLCSYGITKLMVEKYFRLYNHLYGFDGIITRLSNPYGERQNLTYNHGLVTTLLYKIITKQDIEIWGDGKIVRDYIYIKDAVNGLEKVLTYNGSHKLFNISSGKGLSINQILEVISKTLKIKLNVKYKRSRKFDVKQNVLDYSLALRELKWFPKTTLEEGIRITYNWLLKNTGR